MLRKPISCLLKWKQQHYSNLKESVFLKLYSLQHCWCSAAGDKLWDLINMFMFYTINNRTTLYSGTEKTLRCNIRNSKLHVGPNGIIVTSQAVTNCIWTIAIRPSVGLLSVLRHLKGFMEWNEWGLIEFEKRLFLYIWWLQPYSTSGRYCLYFILGILIPDVVIPARQLAFQSLKQSSAIKIRDSVTMFSLVILIY